MSDLKWWQSGIFYQIYPRSFADSNRDGIGDLDGITAHLDYLNGGPDSLGIDAIWLNPINPSPFKDWGYDVSDYCGVHPDYGDLAAFDRLVREAHRRSIRVVVDLVPNHTSDQHPWFIESRSSATNPKRDWYLWAPGTADNPPNNWQSTFGGPAWKYDAHTGAWYLHMFLEEQPDLNYRNPEVIDAMHDVLRFWLGRGADGFRIDVVAGLIKDEQLRDNPIRAAQDPDIPWYAQGSQDPLYSNDRPEVHRIIRGFRAVSDSYKERVLVGETWPRNQEHLADYLRPDELHLGFNFRFLHARYEAARFRAAIEQTEKSFGPGAWPTWTLSNHDFMRHLSRYARGGDGEARARVAAVMIMTLRGTPFIYYGEEIGMREVKVPGVVKRDPVGRDGCRTPMQWSSALNGGFSGAAETWLPCGDFKSINVEKQIIDPRSMLSLYRHLIRLRKTTPALADGSYRSFDGGPHDCLVYHREAASQHLIVALNFTAEAREIDTPAGKILFSTALDRIGESAGASLRLAPNEAAILEVSPD
ncbi:MAG: alpha-amylase family glycosyl hydrolase [Candidatus Binatus sp.]|uniref:alpha-amylase family glycosyl hydrolase n=1 Tax=Candidatus Binatus sp. TaxID=2811406 RepID=UPI0027265E5B|nr:alpha-amylase family glycosyl hydrolase [Candidatus Binatus sp.]MDO8431542.1 alpha-amylase family glycosyl hydrolase [Candidatus Binatus sp.]